MLRTMGALALAHTAVSGIVRSPIGSFTCVCFEACVLHAVELIPHPAGHRVDCLSGSRLGGGKCNLMRATVWLGSFTAALRSGLAGGEGLRGIGSPWNLAGARVVVACDFQQDAKGSPKLVGWLVRLNEGITHLLNFSYVTTGFWVSQERSKIGRQAQVLLYTPFHTQENGDLFQIVR